MMRRPNPRTATIGTIGPTPSVGSKHKPEHIRLVAAGEFAGPSATLGTCFEQCSPIRTRCPGPAAQMSVNNHGRWMPVCRRAVQ